MSKFNNIPEEKDTEIIFRVEAKLGDFDILYEKWKWDGILAESIIFDEEDVSEMDDDEIINKVKDSPLFDDKIYKGNPTIRHNSGFVFVNLNFFIE
jgi:hypothetical protein|tara:strand:+ start:294 stop:581 length:288 start_codon:yes stop_codon:yes gene_type:complete